MLAKDHPSRLKTSATTTQFGSTDSSAVAEPKPDNPMETTTGIISPVASTDRPTSPADKLPRRRRSQQQSFSAESPGYGSSTRRIVSMGYQSSPLPGYPGHSHQHPFKQQNHTPTPFPFATASGYGQGAHSRSISSSTTRPGALSSSPISVPEPGVSVLMTKEKEFMANTRILAMSNIIDSFTSSSVQTKQGYYGKQLKIIGTAMLAESVASDGGASAAAPALTQLTPGNAEVDISIKIHVIENNIWTACPLLPSSTIPHRWNITQLTSKSYPVEDENMHEENGSDLAAFRDEKDNSWVQAILEKTEGAHSSTPSPTFEKQQYSQQRRKRPVSTSSVSSILTQSIGSSLTNATAETHIAVISNAHCFVTNKAGDYLVQLSIQVPFISNTGSQSIYLTQIPKCRSNFVKFQVLPAPGSPSHRPGLDNHDDNNDNNASLLMNFGSGSGGLEFNVHPNLVSLDDVRLNPDSDEDAQFWLEVQEELGRDSLSKILVGNAKDSAQKLSSSVNSDSSAGTKTKGSLSDQGDNAEEAGGDAGPFEVAGCFGPSSTLHISWVPKHSNGFVQQVDHHLNIQMLGLPDETKPSSLLQDRRRKDPEDSHAMDQEDLLHEFDYLEIDDGDLNLAVHDALTVNVQKIGWKQPYMDLAIELVTDDGDQTGYVTLLDISGDSVESWEMHYANEGKDEPEKNSDSLEHDDPEADNLSLKDLNGGDDDDSENDDKPASEPRIYRVWFYSGTEGTTTVDVKFRVCQEVTVGYGRDIVCFMPKVRVLGAVENKGKIHLQTGNDLVVQRCNLRLLENCPFSDPLAPHQLLDEDRDYEPVQKRPNSSSGLEFQFHSASYQLSVIVHRYQSLARIARIERVHAEIGVSARQQPGFARVTLTNVVLASADDTFLRILQLDGAEIWNVVVDGQPCSKSIQIMDRKPSSGQRTVLVPIPNRNHKNNSDSGGIELVSADAVSDDTPHQVEISYGFNTVEVEQSAHDSDQEEEGPGYAIKIVVPGFNLPVGEYSVVASLPKLSQGLDYDDPQGDFEVVSSQGRQGQRRTITYGSFMTTGRPKLLIRPIKVTSEARSCGLLLESFYDSVVSGTSAARGSATETGTAETLEQISSTHAHAGAVAHDPQQPPAVLDDEPNILNNLMGLRIHNWKCFRTLSWDPKAQCPHKALYLNMRIRHL
ncbi:hypothetical protein BGW38_005410 [Lunasporangiospora selenospora]|uniref:Uncharacterized protein n=1 Tax=Lunasporangiospora selenospora TaxID=979761 RepID=A0A9P6FZJ6_9FUNG|nr:hypothetical protein BGW38_005410 [Lunasporangiospora selenospora]